MELPHSCWTAPSTQHVTQPHPACSIGLGSGEIQVSPSGPSQCIHHSALNATNLRLQDRNTNFWTRYSERLSSAYATGACYSWNIFQAGLLNPSGSKVISVFLFWRCTMDTTWTRDTKSNSHINVTPKLDRVRSPAWNMFDVACSHATYFEMGF